MYRFRCVQLYGTTCTKANCRGSQTLFPVHIVPLLVSESHRSFTEVSKLRLLLPSACLLEQQLCPRIASCHPFINCYSNYYHYCPGHAKKPSFWHIMGSQRYLANHILSKNTLYFSIPLLTSVIISDCRAFFLAGCITELSASDGQQEKVGNLHVTCDLCNCANAVVQFEELLDVCVRYVNFQRSSCCIILSQNCIRKICKYTWKWHL